MHLHDPYPLVDDCNDHWMIRSIVFYFKWHFIDQEQLPFAKMIHPECLPLVASKSKKESTRAYGRNESTDSLSNIQDGEEVCFRKNMSYHDSVAIQIEPGQATRSVSSISGINLSASNIDWDAALFAIRMAVLLTILSLFVLIRTPTWHCPDGMWGLVSVLFVCWFPSLDAASVVEKIVQQLIGTFVGAALGLSLGFFSLWAFQTRSYRRYSLDAAHLSSTLA